jgi:uncharacterized protein YjbI with pentapeptide repeats
MGSGHCRDYAESRSKRVRRASSMNFSNQHLDGAKFRNCSLANAIFDGVNLSGATLTNVNLSGLAVENANIKGLKIFGYDVEAWIKTQLAKDGCHLD